VQQFTIDSKDGVFYAGEFRWSPGYSSDPLGIRKRELAIDTDPAWKNLYQRPAEGTEPNIVGSWVGTFSDPKGVFTLGVERQTPNGHVFGKWSGRLSWGQRWEEVYFHAVLTGNILRWKNPENGAWGEATVQGTRMRGSMALWEGGDPWQFTATNTKTNTKPHAGPRCRGGIWERRES
jgi:hypothetical protein